MMNAKEKIKILPPTQLFLILSAEVIFHFVWPIKKLIGYPFNLSGIIIILFGIAINLWADSLFKKYRTTVKPNEKPSYLIDKGPFRISRHPMYLGMVSILLGAAFFLGSAIVFIFPIIFFLIIDRKFIPMEEKIMAEEFGERYYAYQKKVRKWI